MLIRCRHPSEPGLLSLNLDRLPSAQIRNLFLRCVSPRLWAGGGLTVHDPDL
jgi:hypothetical protein